MSKVICIIMFLMFSCSSHKIEGIKLDVKKKSFFGNCQSKNMSYQKLFKTNQSSEYYFFHEMLVNPFVDSILNKNPLLNFSFLRCLDFSKSKTVFINADF